MHNVSIPQLRQRAVILKAIRDFFWEKGFLEVETPQLVPLPSLEPYLEVFETQLLDQNRQPSRAFLTSSPEYSMKKLLARGSGNLFQICKSYRNAEGVSSRHNPEFTILEWYRVEADYTDIMNDCEDLFRFIGKTLKSTKNNATQNNKDHHETGKYEQRPINTLRFVPPKCPVPKPVILRSIHKCILTEFI